MLRSIGFLVSSVLAAVVALSAVYLIALAGWLRLGSGAGEPTGVLSWVLVGATCAGFVLLWVGRPVGLWVAPVGPVLAEGALVAGGAAGQGTGRALLFACATLPATIGSAALTS